MNLESNVKTPDHTPEHDLATAVREATNPEIALTAPGMYRVIRRNGKITSFTEDKIKIAITKAFLAVEGGNAAASARIHEIVANLTENVVSALTRRKPD